MLFFMTRRELENKINNNFEQIKNIIRSKEYVNFICSEINESISKNSLKDDDIRRIVKQEIRIAGCTTAEQTKNDDKYKNEQAFNQLNKNFNAALNTFRGDYLNKISEQANSIEQLKDNINREISKNSSYESKILSLNNEILLLKNKIGSMQAEINYLSESIGKLLISNTAEICEKADEIKPCTVQIEASCEEIKNNIVFDYDFDNNIKILRNILNQTVKLKNDISDLLTDSENKQICNKIVDKCINSINELIEKMNTKELSPEKLASECSKIFKRSIVNIMGQREIKDTVHSYMDRCNIKRLDWKIGRKLTDSDYEYLEEPILYVDVNSKELKGTIQEIKQDTYVIEYMDDDEKYEAVIPGIYCLGKYNG